MLPTDLTVAAVVENNGRYLIVEETVGGLRVITQPGGHIEAGESPEGAVRREVFEESGCEVDVRELIATYLWIHPQTRQQYLRIVYAADFIAQPRRSPPDSSIHAVHWMSRADIVRRSRDCRSPVVLRCINDYDNGQRQARETYAGLMPIHKHVDDVLATARLI